MLSPDELALFGDVAPAASAPAPEPEDDDPFAEPVAKPARKAPLHPTDGPGWKPVICVCGKDMAPGEKRPAGHQIAHEGCPGPKVVPAPWITSEELEHAAAAQFEPRPSDAATALVSSMVEAQNELFAAVLPPDAPPSDPTTPAPAKRGRKAKAVAATGPIGNVASEPIVENLARPVAPVLVDLTAHSAERRALARELFAKVCQSFDSPDAAAAEAYRLADAFLAFKG